MPKKGTAMPVDQQARHATAMASPLRKIVGTRQVDAWSTGAPIYAEVLECGHTGHAYADPEDTAALIAAGKRRRCLSCGKE